LTCRRVRPQHCVTVVWQLCSGRFGVAVFALAIVLAVPDVHPSGQQPAAARFDSSVRPQDDLFRHVNAPWLASADIPPEKVSYGTLVELGDRVEADLRAIIEDTIARGGARRGSLAQQVGDLYASLMDETRIESLGYTPIKPELDRIYAARTASDFAAAAGRMSAMGGGGPFDGSVDTDSETGQLVVRLAQSGILLPDRDYYMTDTPRYRDVRSRYIDYLTRIFTLVGRADARREAEAVLGLETELARAQWSQSDGRDPLKTANRVAFSDLPRAFPGFDWREWAKPQGIDRLQTVVIAQPSFFKRFAELASATPLETWRAWLAARYITSSAPFISQAFSDARFDFFGTELSGQELPRVRWRRAVSLVSGYLGDAVGRLYVQQHFPPASKARVERLVSGVIDAFGEAVSASDWMAPATKRKALRKLSLLKTNIGYPRAWRDYTGLEIRREDLFGNIQRAREFLHRDQLASARGVRPAEFWAVTPQTVNAYYRPALNELTVTAAMLQPPLFDSAADDAVNYGAIGAIIGHEISHGFDDRGRFYGGRGEVADWWTPADVAAFGERARMLVEQFSAFSPGPGLRVDGRLTLSENVGDLAGLSLAWRAYRKTLGGKPSAVIEGLSGEQRFFLSWAVAWRGRMREEYLRQWLLFSPHAPPEFRVNGPLSNLDGFHEAFGVRPGDRLFRAPDQRVRIW
jgi:predicted metalloendopeptidase